MGGHEWCLVVRVAAYSGAEAGRAWPSAAARIPRRVEALLADIRGGMWVLPEVTLITAGVAFDGQF
jgi:hypothetical protein